MSVQELQVTLAHAKPGMRLMRDVLDTRGLVLIPCGTELSDVSIADLQRSHLTALWVEVATDASRQAFQTERLAHLFRHGTRCEVDPYFFDLVSRYREGRKA